MSGQMKEFRPYSINEIPKFKIDYRGLINYAHSVNKTVPELSDAEKERFIDGATLKDVENEKLSYV